MTLDPGPAPPALHLLLREGEEGLSPPSVCKEVRVSVVQVQVSRGPPPRRPRRWFPPGSSAERSTGAGAACDQLMISLPPPPEELPVISLHLLLLTVLNAPGQRKRVGSAMMPEVRDACHLPDPLLLLAEKRKKKTFLGGRCSLPPRVWVWGPPGAGRHRGPTRAGGGAAGADPCRTVRAGRHAPAPRARRPGRGGRGRPQRGPARGAGGGGRQEGG